MDVCVDIVFDSTKVDSTKADSTKTDSKKIDLTKVNVTKVNLAKVHALTSYVVIVSTMCWLLAFNEGI